MAMYKTWEIIPIDGGFMAIHPYDETLNEWALTVDELFQIIDEVEGE